MIQTQFGSLFLKNNKLSYSNISFNMSGLAAASIGSFKDRNAWMITSDGTIVGKARDNSWCEVARHGVPIEVLVDNSCGPEIESCIIQPIVIQNTGTTQFVSVTSHKDCGRSFKKGSKKSMKKQSKSLKKLTKKASNHRTLASNASAKLLEKNLIFEERDAEEYQEVELNFRYNSLLEDSYSDDCDCEFFDRIYDEQFNLVFWHDASTKYGPVYARWDQTRFGCVLDRFCYTCNCKHEIFEQH
jgi:hypothetical protein